MYNDLVYLFQVVNENNLYETFFDLYFALVSEVVCNFKNYLLNHNYHLVNRYFTNKVIDWLNLDNVFSIFFDKYLVEVLNFNNDDTTKIQNA